MPKDSMFKEIVFLKERYMKEKGYGELKINRNTRNIDVKPNKDGKFGNINAKFELIDGLYEITVFNDSINKVFKADNKIVNFIFDKTITKQYKFSEKQLEILKEVYSLTGIDFSRSNTKKLKFIKELLNENKVEPNDLLKDKIKELYWGG